MAFIHKGERIYIGELPYSTNFLKPTVYLLQIDEYGNFYLVEKRKFRLTTQNIW